MNTIPILFFFLSIQSSYSQDITRVSEFKTSTFMGEECDDTEYRNSNGRPNWKNYGQWLSECDSISTTYYDIDFAKRRKKKLEEERIAKEKEDAEALEDLDLDAMWENTVWVEIQDVVTVQYEVENVTAVAGVRGAEAEDEALALLYYRRSMKELSELQLRKALGKLMNKRSELVEQGKVVPEEIDKYIVQLKTRLKIS